MARVLVADDDRAIRQLIANLLSLVGAAEVVEAEDGGEALDWLRRGEFDLLVLDRYMPNVCGLDVIRSVRASGSRVPIVMVTGESRKDQVVEALRAGANEYLIKPFDHEVLRQKLQRYCQQDAPWGKAAVHRARDAMRRTVVTISPDASVGQAIERLLQHGVSGLPVVDGRGNLVGIITEFQLIRAIHQPEIKEEAVRDLMTRDVLAVNEETELAVVAKIMEKHRVRRIPVTRNGKVVGIISRRDLLQYLSRHEDAQSELLGAASLAASA
jgi:two-component system chemotaxis response regulator CheY